MSKYMINSIQVVLWSIIAVSMLIYHNELIALLRFMVKHFFGV